MIVNGKGLLAARPLEPMFDQKHKAHGVSYGLSEAGYDIRVAQTVRFLGRRNLVVIGGVVARGRFALASAMETFSMPSNLVGIVHDKSTWARQGLSVFNTVIEPKFCGGLTLELVYHGFGELVVPAGAGIAQVLFHCIQEDAAYAGKYQGQPTDPTPARFD